MKFNTLALAAAVLMTATGYGLAQSSPPGAPADGTKATTQSGAMSKEQMAKEQLGKENMKNGKMSTTGSGGTTPMKDTAEKNKSPAAPDAGLKQEK